MATTAPAPPAHRLAIHLSPGAAGGLCPENRRDQDAMSAVAGTRGRIDRIRHPEHGPITGNNRPKRSPARRDSPERSQ